jgi:hypothetical protein
MHGTALDRAPRRSRREDQARERARVLEYQQRLIAIAGMASGLPAA